jgi:uncharacterized protein YgiB involved in biofilm formation
MSNKIRRSSAHVKLVLIGMAAAATAATLSGCSKEEVRRDVYASKEDCLADWGNTPQDCEPAYDRRTGSATTTHYYGRPYSYRGGGSGNYSGSPSRSGKTIGSSSVSRGGFGSSGHSASG